MNKNLIKVFTIFNIFCYSFVFANTEENILLNFNPDYLLKENNILVNFSPNYLPPLPQEDTITVSFTPSYLPPLPQQDTIAVSFTPNYQPPLPQEDTIAVSFTPSYLSPTGDIVVSFTPDYQPPAQIVDMTSVPAEVSPSEITLTWTAPGNNGTVGEIVDGQYNIKYDDHLVNGQLECTHIIWSTTTVPGSIEKKTVTGLIYGTTYYFQIRAADISGNWSDWSDIVSAQTSVVISNSTDEIVSLASNISVDIVSVSTVTVDISYALSTATLQGLHLVSNIYDITPNGTVFSPPAEFTFKYDTNIVIDTSTLAIYKWTGVEWTSATITNQVVLDSENPRVEGNIYSLSYYGLFLYDKTPPEITINSPKGLEKFIATVSTITINYNVADNLDPASKVFSYLTKLENGTTVSVKSGDTIDPLDIESGFWTLTVEATDWVGNYSSSTTAKFEIIHDIQPPRSEADVHCPKFISDSKTYITFATEISLSAIDDLIEIGDGKGLGVKSIKYKVVIASETTQSDFIDYAVPFSIPQESSHTITYYSVDVIGNTEQIQTINVTVDNTAPMTEISVSSPQYTSDGKLWISSETAISLSATDGGIIPCGVRYTEYKLDETGWQISISPIGLIGLTEGEHTITYRSYDNLLNCEVDKSLKIIIDNSEPETFISVSEPKFNEYITSDSQFMLVAVDSGTIPSGIKETKYSVSNSTNINTDFAQYISTYNITGADGIYTIAYYSKDNVENTEETRINTVKLDNTKPVSQLQITDYKFQIDGKTYITPETQIIISAQDPTINEVASGLKAIYYSIDDLPLITYDLPLTFTEGVHKIKYYSVDNLGNTEQTNEKILYVDGTAPITNIIIGEPKFSAFGTNYISPETPITLTATDPVSNGVASGVKKIQFRVDSSEFIDYVSSFTLTEGSHTIDYRSMDNLQNTEETKSVKVTVTYIIEYAAFGANELKVNGQGKIYGNARSNNKVKLDGQAFIDGDVYGSTITLTGNSRIMGQMSQNAPTLSTDAIDLDTIQNYVSQNNDNSNIPQTQKGKPAIVNGVLTLSGQDSLTITTGTYYFTDIDISGGAVVNISGQVNIFCTGKIQISGQSRFNTGGNKNDLAIFVNSSDDKDKSEKIKIDGQSELTAIVYAPYSGLKIDGKSKAVGSLFARTADVNGESTISVNQPQTQTLASIGVKKAEAAPTFTLGEVYSFPNPAKRGVNLKIHIECGVADKVEIKMYNIAGELVHSTELYGMPSDIRGKYAYEYNWDISDIASGVYIYIVRAKKSGYPDIKKTGKIAVIK
ncbi:MAG: fibronectin type III domain-containing protein [Elusimicrobia bacterium]|nr:fibronectin type III domain-containing protein [Elusimicrobiota bacterium]